MIIPVRCFTCGKVLADKWNAYQERCLAIETQEAEREAGNSDAEPSDKTKKHSKNFENAYRGKVMDDLRITRICCRRHMLGHVDCIDWI